jgi:acetyl-CoA acetyltransferase
MSLASKAVFIVGAKRTPFGSFGGKLKHLTATDLGVIASKGAIAHANIAPEKLGECFYGNCIQSALDAAYLSRHVLLRAGGPITAPALSINRLCGRYVNFTTSLHRNVATQ